MADIRITSTNRTFFQVDGTLAAILCEAFPAAFERVLENAHAHERAQAVAAANADANAVTFSVRKNPHSDKFMVAMHQGSYEEGFYGSSDQLIDYPFGGKANRRCPRKSSNSSGRKWKRRPPLMPAGCVGANTRAS
jgi:hypothetical protein